MHYVYSSFKAAKEAAIRESQREKDVAIYVLWTSGDEWTTAYEEEIANDSYAFNGEWVYSFDGCEG